MIFLVRLTLLLLLTLAVYGVARKRSAALRHAVLVAGMMASLALPMLPAMRRAEVSMPERVAAVARPVETVGTGFSLSRDRLKSVPTVSTWRMIWAAGAALCLLRIALSHAAARRLLRRGESTRPPPSASCGR